jgi:hypothetical protein
MKEKRAKYVFVRVIVNVISDKKWLKLVICFPCVSNVFI